MNEPACRAYRALYYLPSYTAAPTLNLTLRLSLTLTLLLQTPRTLNYRRAARHPNRLRSVAVPQCQPTNADSRRGHYRTTLTTVQAGLPHPATWASLLDTGAWTVARNCPIAQVRYTYTNGAALSAVRFLLKYYRKPSRQPGYRRLPPVGVANVFL